MISIYLDTCALNRPSDDQSQQRIREETDALGRVLDLVHLGRISWFSSSAVRSEIQQNRDPIRRIRALDLLSSASQTLTPDPESLAEAATLVTLGFAAMDALHLALAHIAKVDWLLTTDDRFIRTAERRLQTYRPVVLNPVDWLQRRQIWLLQRPSR